LLFHLNIPGRGEHHLFQTPPPIEKKFPPTTTRNYFNKYPTTTRKKIIIRIISFVETPNPNLNEIKNLQNLLQNSSELSSQKWSYLPLKMANSISAM
jgi:hypothetical protein